MGGGLGLERGSYCCSSKPHGWWKPTLEKQEPELHLRRIALIEHSLTSALPAAAFCHQLMSGSLGIAWQLHA
jgi:hypothetical protein